MGRREDLELQIQRNPNSLKLRLDFARVMLQQRDHRGALAATQQALEINSVHELAERSELQQLEERLLSEYTPTLVGPLYEFCTPEQAPGFAEGQLVELVVNLDRRALEAFEQGLKSPELSKLELLGVIVEEDLPGNKVLDILTQSRLPKLLELNLWFKSRFGTGPLNRLVQSDGFKQLEVFYLRGPKVSDGAVRMIAQQLGTLLELRIRSDDIESLTEQAAYAIADADGARQLEVLALVGSVLGDAGVLALSTCSKLHNLRRLELRDGILSNEGARILASHTGLTGLEELDVSYNSIDEAGLDELRSLGLKLKEDHQHALR